MEGYLYKWTNLFKGWKKRYFILNGSILNYCKKKGEKIKGKIHLSITNCDLKGSNIIIIDTGVKKIELKAENTAERNNWINILRVAKHQGQLKDKENNMKKDDEIKTQPVINDENSFRMFLMKSLDEMKNNLDEFTSINNKLIDSTNKKSSVKKEVISEIYLNNMVW